LQHVYDSLTANGQGVLKIIIKDQIAKIKEKKDGPSFKGTVLTHCTTLKSFARIIQTLSKELFGELGGGAEGAAGRAEGSSADRRKHARNQNSTSDEPARRVSSNKQQIEFIFTSNFSLSSLLPNLNQNHTKT